MSQTIGAGGGGSIMQNSNTVTSNTTISSGSNSLSIGPITINSGVTVTVSSGGYWVII